MTPRGNECGQRTTLPGKKNSVKDPSSSLDCSTVSSEKTVDEDITTDVIDVTGWDFKRVYRLLLAHSDYAHAIRLKNGSNYFVLAKCPSRLLGAIALEIVGQAPDP